MKDSSRYVKVVEWSEKDKCFVGSCPGLFYGGCHGKNEKAVFEHFLGAAAHLLGGKGAACQIEVWDEGRHAGQQVELHLAGDLQLGLELMAVARGGDRT